MDSVDTPCDDCKKVEIEQLLTAAEALRAFDRSLVKADRDHEDAKDLATHQDSLARAAQSEKAAQDADLALAAELLKSQRASEDELTKLYHTTITEVAKGAIDRARDSAKFIQTAATAIFALYTGLLALVFSVTDNPLPLRGVWAGAFLGLAIALSSAYLAFVKKAPALPLVLPGQSLTQLQHARTSYLAKWTNAVVGNRRWAIRASVLSLGLGVGFLAAPFVSSGARADVPAAPVAPSIPSEVAPPVSDDAVRLFKIQVDDFAMSVQARATALKAHSEEATTRSKRESRLDGRIAWLAVLALIVIAVGPVIYEQLRD